MMSLRKKVFQLSFVSLVAFSALVAMFLLVNPTERSLVYIFIPVVLLWIATYAATRVLYIVIRRRETRLTRILLFTTVSLGILMLLLSGIGQLQAVDIALITSLAMIVAFYFYRSWA